MAGYENLCVNCMEDTGGSNLCPKCGFREEETQMIHALPYKTVLQNRYVVGKAQKSNGEGITYIGFDLILKVKVEIREYFPQTLCERAEGSSDLHILGGSEIVFDEYLANFLNYSREIAHMRELLAIEQIYDIFEERGTAYRVCEWKESISLRYFVERSGGFLNWNAARQLFMPVLSALSTLHKNGISHLGISPDTLVILKDGKMKLTDFCIDTIRKVDTELPPDMVPGCAAVEQYVMDDPLNETTDVYSFAATIFFTLTGILPQDALKRRTDARLLIPTSILKTLPPHVVTALANALQVPQEKRTPSFEGLRAELSASPTVTAKIEMTQPLYNIPSPYPPAPERKKGIPGVVWAICSCVVALAVFTGIGFLWLSNTPSAEPVESSMAVVSSSAPVSNPNTTSSAVSSVSSNLQMINAPDLVNQKYDDVIATAKNEDYQVLLSSKQFSDAVGEGYIISQEPQPGKQIEKGSTIIVIISEGTAMRTLPNIQNLSLADASAKVSAAGFTPVKAESYSSSVPAGKMIGYKDVMAGSKMNFGAQVVMLMSRGPETAMPPISAEQNNNSETSSKSEID